MADEFDPYSKGVEYQVTKVDPTDPTTKGAVYQVHKVDEVTAAMSGKFYRARIIKDPDDPTVMGKVYQIVIIDDPDDPSVKGKVYNAIITGDQEAVVVGPVVPPLDLDSAVADTLAYINAYGGLLQGGVPSGYTAVEYVENAANTMVKTAIHIGNDDNFKMDITATAVDGSFYLFQARDSVSANYGNATICGIAGAQNTRTINGVSGGSTSLASGIFRENRDGHKLNIVFECADGDMSLYVKDIDGNVSDTQTGTYDPTALTRPATNMCIYGNEAPTISTALPKNRLQPGCKVYGAKLWKNGVLVLDYVPATRDSDSAVGFYDRISHTFVTAADGSLTAGSSLAPTPSAPVDLVCNNGALKVLDKTQWTYITNPTPSQPNAGVFIDSTGLWKTASDRGAGVVIPLTIGKQYTLLIHKKTQTLGTLLRYGQSPQATPTNAGIQLTDWYRGEIADGQIVSFVAKQPYFVMQLSAAAAEAGMMQEAIEVLEAQGGDYTFLKYIEATGTQYIETGLSGAMRWVGAGKGTSDSNGSKCILSALASSANVYLASRFASAATGKYWTIDATTTSQIPTLSYAEYDIDFASNSFTGTINGAAVSRSNTFIFTTWTIGIAFGTGTIQYPFIGYIYRQQAYQNNVLVGDFIPAIRNSDNVVGMYDTVSGTFFTNAGTGTFVAGTPLGDGEVLKLTPSNDTAGVANLFAVNTYKDVQEIITGTVKHKVNVYVLNGEETAWNDVVSSSSYAMPKTALGSDSNVLPNKSTDVICSHYSVAATESGTGVQDIIWVGGSNVNFKTKSTYATLQDWKDYLAAQYAAGTPVIVIVPFATEYTEPAPVPQTMQVVAGDNTLDIVQAGMSGLEVEVKYTKGG